MHMHHDSCKIRTHFGGSIVSADDAFTGGKQVDSGAVVREGRHDISDVASANGERLISPARAVVLRVIVTVASCNLEHAR